MESIIIDTDIGNDIDDVIALCMACKLHRDHKVNLVAILISNGDEASDVLTARICDFYGVQVPIFRNKRGVLWKTSRYIAPTLEMIGREHSQKINWFDPKIFCEKFLKNETVKFISIGFFTNISEIAETCAPDWSLYEGVDFYHMAGNFKHSKSEFNVFCDPRSFDKFVGTSKLHSYFVGFEIGREVDFEYDIIRQLAKVHGSHPLCVAYGHYRPTPYNRSCWDPVTLLIALDNKYKDSFSDSGKVWRDAENLTKFFDHKGGNHYIFRANQKDLDELQSSIRNLFL